MEKITRKIKKELSYIAGSYAFPPDYLSLLVTLKCNFKCKMCNIWKTHEHAEIGVNEWDTIIKDIEKTFPKKTFIEINGGEPLIKKDLVLHIIRLLDIAGFKTTLNTNASLLDGKTISELEEAGLHTVKISLYSLSDEIHDNIRGFRGAGEKAFDAINLLSLSKIKTELGLLITNQNISSARNFIEHFENKKNLSIIIQPLDEPIEATSGEKSREIPSDMWPKKNDVEKFFQWLLENNHPAIKNSKTNLKAIRDYYIESKSVLHRKCYAGQHSAIIYPNGDLSLCFKRKPVGNVLKNKIEEIFGGQNSLHERRGIRKCRKHCRIVGCNFSRTIGEILNLQ